MFHRNSIPIHDDADDSDEADAADAVPAVIKDAAVLLASAVLGAALTAKQRAMLTGPAGKTIIITVPSANYMTPLFKVVHALNGLAHVHPVSQSKRKGATDDVDLSHYFAKGITVVAITPDVSLLQPALHAAVDLSVNLKPPSAAMVRRVIFQVTGGRARGLSDADLAGSDLNQIAAAIRPGSSARDCVHRLKRPPAPKADDPAKTPDLSTLPLFGAAQTWVIETLDTFAHLQRGTMLPADIEHTLLFGPPGTGKTVLARALASAAGIGFVDTSVAAWFTGSDGNLDGVLKAADAFFASLLAQAPCIGFMDELEALPDRATLDSRNREWWSSIVTGVLLMVTRVRDSGKPVMLIGATNYLHRIDSALKRPGRLGRHVLVRPAETEAEVALLLRYYLPTELDDAAIATSASMAGSATPAEVEGWVKTALNLARQANRALALNDLLAQIAPPDTRSPDEQYGVAVHEAGHAVAALVLGLDLRRVSIVASGSMGGVTSWQPPPRAQRLSDFEDQVVLILAGRAADAILGAGADTGARSDLELATTMLVSADASLGLRKSLVFRAEEHAVLSLLRSDTALALRIETALRRLMARSHRLVETHRNAIIAVARALVERRMLNRDQVEAILARVTNQPRLPVENDPLPDEATDDMPPSRPRSSCHG